MKEHASNNHEEVHDKDTWIASSFMDKSMSLSDSWVDREAFLTKELRVHCTDDQVHVAISTNPAIAGIPIELIDEIADSVINSHVRKATAVSFVAGIPGFVFAPITVPTDIVQLYRRQIRLAQELAYLYGWPELRTFGEPDEETKNLITLLLGTMFGVREAGRALNVISPLFANQVEKRVAKQALTKTIYYPALKKTLKWIGISLTKKSFASFLAKFGVPVISGVTSAGLSHLAVKRSARKLKSRLRELRFAQPPHSTVSIEVDA